MTNDQTVGNYVVISPVKDEEQYVETTIRAVVKQTVRPKAWIIVDDGSTDRTPEILDAYAEQFEWIRVMRTNKKSARQPGSAVIRAFDVGYQESHSIEFDFIVKLDCDLDLPANYFERLLKEFRDDATLGIASGLHVEKRKGTWQLIEFPAYHAVGASKMIRMRCFEQIGGFVPMRGWDTVDEIRAQAAGWRTKHFADLTFYHLKPEGIGIGYLRTNMMHGEIYYLTGGGIGFFVLKTIDRCLFGEPFIVGGLLLGWGYSKALLARRPRLVNREEARAYRRLLNGRISQRVHNLLRKPQGISKSWRYS